VIADSYLLIIYPCNNILHDIFCLQVAQQHVVAVFIANQLFLFCRVSRETLEGIKVRFLPNYLAVTGDRPRFF
jgi:hypothetical protein